MWKVIVIWRSTRHTIPQLFASCSTQEQAQACADRLAARKRRPLFLHVFGPSGEHVRDEMYLYPRRR